MAPHARKKHASDRALQPAPEPVYEGGARSPTKPTNPYIVVSISQKRHFEQQKCKGFLHRLCKGFFGRVYRKNAGNGRFGRLLARNARLRREKAAKKGAAGLFAAADTRKRLNGEVWRTRRSAKVNSYRPAFPGRSIFAEGAERAHRSFRSLANIGVLRADRAHPLYLLVRKYRRSARWPRAALVFAHAFGSLCRLWRQQPTGLTLPSGAPLGRFGPSAQVPTGLALPYGAGRAGNLRPWAQTFLKHPAKKIGVSRAFPTHDSRYRRCPACRGRRRRRGGSIPGAGAGEAPRAAARSPRG